MSEPGRAGRSELPPHLDPRGRRSPVGLPRAPAAERGSAPVPSPGTGSRAGRVLALVAAALSVTIFAIAGLGYLLYSRYDGQIHRIPGLSSAMPGLTQPPAAPRDARNLLLVGSDSRANVSRKFGSEPGQRSDTIILAHLYGGSDAAQLVSFPRDSYVTIPGYTDPATGVTHPERSDKINAAFNEGGPALLKATVERLTGIRVDNYVQIDFAGFQSMVDKLGGLEVCLRHAAKDSYSQIDLPAGRQTVRGAQALAFVRQRHGLPHGDLDRIRRQQAFIASVARKALSSGTLLNPVRLNGFLDAATSSVVVDDGLSGAGLTQLALRLRNFSAGGVSFSTLPYTSLGAARNGQSVVLLDEPKTAALFDALRRDVAPAKPRSGAAKPAPLDVQPGDVRVAVLNAAGERGLGSRAAADLRRVGFAVVDSPGNRGTGASTTVVRHGPGDADAARTLAAAVPGATLQADDQLSGVVELVVGSSYRGAVPVRVGTAPASGPAGSAPPAAGARDSEPALTADQDGCVD